MSNGNSSDRIRNSDFYILLALNLIRTVCSHTLYTATHFIDSSPSPVMKISVQTRWTPAYQNCFGKYIYLFMSLCFDVNFKKNIKEVWGFYKIKEWLSTRLIKCKKKIHLKQCTVLLCFLNKKVNKNKMIHIFHTHRNLMT